MTIQATGGTKRRWPRASSASRRCCGGGARQARDRPASEIVLALQCGGSDGYTRASPPIRRSASAVDMWSSMAAPASWPKTPEIYGAEHLLTRRAVNRSVGEKMVERIRWWEDYTERNLGAR